MLHNFTLCWKIFELFHQDGANPQDAHDDSTALPAWLHDRFEAEAEAWRLHISTPL